MSSDKRGFWGFLRRKERKSRPFVDFLEREKRPETKKGGEEASLGIQGKKSLDELFVDWDSGRVLEEDLSKASREEEREAESIPPTETVEPPELLVEFPPLLEEEELAQLVERRDAGNTAERPFAPAEGKPVMPAEQDREERLEVRKTSEEEEKADRISGPPPERGPTSEEIRAEQAVSQAASEAVEALKEIRRLLVALEVQVAERLVEARSGP